MPVAVIPLQPLQLPVYAVAVTVNSLTTLLLVEAAVVAISFVLLGAITNFDWEEFYLI